MRCAGVSPARAMHAMAVAVIPEGLQLSRKIDRVTTPLSISIPKARVICWAMRTQPKCGLRRFSATMAAMSSADRPYGPGLGRGDAEEEKSRRYLRSTRAAWHLSSVAGLASAPRFGSRARKTARSVRVASHCQFAIHSYSDAGHSPVRNRVQRRFSARLSSSVRVRSDTSFARIASVG